MNEAVQCLCGAARAARGGQAPAEGAARAFVPAEGTWPTAGAWGRQLGGGAGSSSPGSPRCGSTDGGSAAACRAHGAAAGAHRLQCCSPCAFSFPSFSCSLGADSCRGWKSAPSPSLSVTGLPVSDCSNSRLQLLFLSLHMTKLRSINKMK